MHKTSFFLAACAAVFAACSALAYTPEKPPERMPPKEKMDAVHDCIIKSRLNPPQPGYKPMRLSDDERKIADQCFKDNGVEPPSEAQRVKMNVVHECLAKGGIHPPEPGTDKPPRLSDAEQKVVQKCFRENNIEPPLPPGN